MKGVASVAMETDSNTEKMTCFMLFRKFIREVRAYLASLKKFLGSSNFSLAYLESCKTWYTINTSTWH